MSNGQINAAELEAVLTGDRRAVDRYLVTGIQQLGASVEALRRTCDQRGKTCPAVVQTRTVRALAGRIVDRLAIPVVVCLLTLGVTKLVG